MQRSVAKGIVMDCDLETFTSEILGKWGFTMDDWIYLQQAYEREKQIQKLMNIRDGITDNNAKDGE